MDGIEPGVVPQHCPFFKVKISANGEKCKFIIRCNFAHSLAELRKPDTPLESQRHFFRCYFGESSAISHTLWAGAFSRPTCTPRHFRHTQNDLQHAYCAQCAALVVSAGAFQLPREGMVTERV